MRFKKILLSVACLSLFTASVSCCSKSDIDDFLNKIDSTIKVDGSVGIIDKINGVVDTIKDWGSNAWNNTIDWGSNAWDTVSTWGKSTWSQVVDWSTNAGEAVADWSETAIKGTKNFFCTVGDYIVNVAKGTVTFGLKKGVDSLDLSKGLEEEGTEEDWKDYLSDYEAITYALVSTQLKKIYDVFPAKLEIPSTKQEVYGYGFTDYDTGYVYHEGEKDQENYYSAGFISLVDEFVVPASDIKKGIEIYKTEDSDSSSTRYFYGYDCEPFDTHCIVKGQYLKYGVNKDHQIYFENSKYDGTSDKSLGGLYSFDDKAYVYGEDNGFVPKKGNVIDESFDFDSWKKETKTSFLKGFSLKLTDLKNMISDAVMKVKTVINNLNEQTILGYNINDIKKAVNGTTENDIAIVEDDKVALHAVSNEVPSGLSSTAKWIVGICTGIAIIADIAVGIFVLKNNPYGIAINAAVSAITGAVVELAIETLIDNKGFKDVNWIKVGIAAIAGCLVSIIPAQSTFKYNLSASLIAAMTNMSYCFLDGGSFLDSAISFVSGFAVAMVLASAMTALINGVKKLATKVAPKLTKKISNFIYSHQITVGGKSMQTTPETMTNSVNRGASDSASNMSVDSRKTVFNTKAAVKHLPGPKNEYFAIADNNGNIISKAELLNNNGNGYLVLKNEKAVEKYGALFVDRYGNSLTRVPIRNGYVQFQNFNSVIVNVGSDKVLVANRSQNFKMFDDCLKETLIKYPDSITPDVMNYFRNLGVDFDNLTYSDFKTMRSILNKTWHEGENRATGILIDTTLHHAISHMGGYSLAKAIVAYSFPSQIIFTIDQLAVGGL